MPMPGQEAIISIAINMAAKSEADGHGQFLCTRRSDPDFGAETQPGLGHRVVIAV